MHKSDNSLIDNSHSAVIHWLIVLLPFVLLFWMMPFAADLTISKDYPLHPITEKIELQFSLKTGSFPLYAPGYHLGHSSTALTLGQLYHPISYIASLLPGYWSGKALEWNTFLRILSLGLTQLALFLFLRQIRINTLFAFILSFVTVYNLRMLEAFRYGAALEAFTGHLLLIAMIGRYYVKPSNWLGPLSIIGTTYLLACSGHPPMMFYGFVAVALFTLVLPYFIASIVPDSGKKALPFWGKTGLFLCLGILLSSVYIVPFYFEFVRNNISYSQSAGLIGVEAPETLAGALNNFFMPFYADLLGSFGGSLLIIMALFLPLLRVFKVKVPSVIWLLWGGVLYGLLFILGPGTPVYVLSHKYVPFILSLGGVGRIAMVLPSVLMLIMAWIINAGAFSVRMRKISVTLTPCSLLGLAALILTPVYLMALFLLRPEFGYFTPHFIRHIPFWIEIISVLLGLLSLGLLVFYNMYSRLARITGILLCIVVLFQVGTILKYGVWMEKKKDYPTFEQLKAQKKESLEYSFQDCPNTQHKVVMEQLSRSFMEPFWGKIFTRVTPVASQEEAYIEMQKSRLPQETFVEDIDPGRAKKLTDGAKDMDKGMVELIYSSFNQVRFRVTSQAPAFFGLSYPYTGHWRAWVNGEPVHVYRGNGAANAVEISAGESLVEFRYWSDAFFWGVLITCLVFVMIGVYISARALEGYVRVACMALVLVTGGSGFVLWYNSIYSGDNLNTKYHWVYSPPHSPENIAYGKKTFGYELPSLSYLNWHSSNVVDGDIRPHSGLPLGGSYDKALIVDLNQNEEIKSIVLYGETSAKPEIYLSQDGTEWEMIDPTFRNNGQLPLRIVFEAPKVARYIKAESSKAKLYLDELEVYKTL